MEFVPAWSHLAVLDHWYFGPGPQTDVLSYRFSHYSFFLLFFIFIITGWVGSSLVGVLATLMMLLRFWCRRCWR